MLINDSVLFCSAPRKIGLCFNAGSIKIRVRPETFIPSPAVNIGKPGPKNGEASALHETSKPDLMWGQLAVWSRRFIEVPVKG